MDVQLLRPAASTMDSGLAWHLQHRPEAARIARRLVRDALDVALVVVSELVTNALEHALPPVVLRLRRTTTDGTVRVEVTDGGPADGCSWLSGRPSDEQGRGTHIVACLAAAHGTLVEPGTGTVVRWADLRSCV